MLPTMLKGGLSQMSSFKVFSVRKFLFLLVLSITQNANSEADGPDHWQVYGVEAGDVLNMRQGPNWKSQKIGEIPPDGKCLKNLKCVHS